jgi:hypothetical protein
MDEWTVTIRLNDDGGIDGVEMEGLPAPEGVTEDVPSAPVKPFGDDEYQAQPRSWLGA